MYIYFSCYFDHYIKLVYYVIILQNMSFLYMCMYNILLYMCMYNILLAIPDTSV